MSSENRAYGAGAFDGSGMRGAPAPAGAGEPLNVQWRDPHDMGGLSLKNFFLKLVTFGIYHFWGKTEVRRRLWGAVSLNGQPLEYTGTGKELFLGFLIVVLVIFLPLTLYAIGLRVYFGPDNPLADILLLPVSVLFFYLTGVAVYRAQRYRLRRTLWRGVRGTMTGNPWRFGWMWFWTALTLLPTLGWSAPWRRVKLARALTDDMRFGSGRFSLEASAKGLLGPFALMWISWAALAGLVLSPLFLGGLKHGDSGALPAILLMASFIVFLAAIYLSLRYAVHVMNHLTSRTRFEGASFALSADVFSLLALNVVNFLITAFTLGIFTPVIQTRVARYFVKRLSASGSVDFSAISQARDKLERTGEGLAEAFDVDMF